MPNILYTDYNCSNEMYSLLIIKHFVFKKAVARYGINNIVISSFLKDCNDLWGGNEDINNKIILCINDLIDKKILLYSVYEKEYSDKHIRFGENRKLYLSSKGLALWELLENDSILIEAYREDVYRDNNDFISDKKNIELPQETVLRDCLQYLKSFIEFETTLLNTVKSSIKSGLYYKLFGNKLISRHIYTGISNTIQYYYHSHGRSISNELYLDNNEVNEMIKSAEDII